MAKELAENKLEKRTTKLAFIFIAAMALLALTAQAAFSQVIL